MNLYGHFNYINVIVPGKKGELNNFARDYAIQEYVIKKILFLGKSVIKS